MKKIGLLIIFCLFIVNVQAETLLPIVIPYKAMITNKEGATCYDENKKVKEDITIPYKTVFNVKYDAVKGLIFIEDDSYSCYVKTDDLGAMDSEFKLDNKEVLEINSTRAIVLAKSGLNLRKGPSTSFHKIVTVPGNAIVTLKYQAGTYWYYVEYENKSGWLTAMNQYIGYDDNKILVNNEITNIYDSNKRIVGKIPANTEITNYVRLVKFYENDPLYYIEYNGIKGYINEMYYKTQSVGTITLKKDIDILNEHGVPYKKITKDQELKYSMIKGENGFYFDDIGFLELKNDDYDYIEKAKLKIKATGYIGEGIFNEEKMAREEEITIDIEQDEIEDKESLINSSMWIIVISGFILGIIITVILVLILLKSRRKDVQNPINEDVNKSEDF